MNNVLKRESLSIDPLEELLVAIYLVRPTGQFRYMDELRSRAQYEASAIRRAIEKRGGDTAE